MFLESRLKQGVAHLDGGLFEKTVVVMDSANVAAGLDDPSDMFDEEYDGVRMAGVVVASGQFVNWVIKLADVKRAFNRPENCFPINRVKALKLELVNRAHLCGSQEVHPLSLDHSNDDPRAGHIRRQGPATLSSQFSFSSLLLLSYHSSVPEQRPQTALWTTPTS